jgi:hypothetical protein
LHIRAYKSVKYKVLTVLSKNLNMNSLIKRHIFAVYSGPSKKAEFVPSDRLNVSKWQQFAHRAAESGV